MIPEPPADRSPEAGLSTIRVAGVQMDITLGDPERNLATMEGYLRQAAAEGAEFVVFPECALAGYCFESLREAQQYAQPIPGPATDRMTELCRELGLYCVFGLLEQGHSAPDQPQAGSCGGSQGGLFNSAVLVAPGQGGLSPGIAHRYRKLHLPSLGVDRFVTPGNDPLEVVQCRWDDGRTLQVGLNICYDGSFPEVARVLALSGAELIVLPTNWPPGAETFARYLINARALENNVYYLAVNRVGVERGFRFIGTSRLCQTDGNDLAVLGPAEQSLLSGDVLPSKARNKHLVRVPGKHEIDRFLDRRPELYGPLVLPVEPEPGHAGPTNAGFGPPETPAHRQLWAPWRLAYVTGGDPSQNSRDQKLAPKKLPEKLPPAKGVTEQPISQSRFEGTQEYPPDLENCFLCRAAASDADQQNLVIARTTRTITVLNRYPYNNGHLLVAPKSHKGALADLTPDEHSECLQAITHLVKLLGETINAQGFNVGLNLGRLAGAGLPGHLHWHIVPRWGGDTNFMPVLAGTRIIPQSLEALWGVLVDALSRDPIPGEHLREQPGSR